MTASRERQLWTEFIRKRESEKKTKRPRTKTKPQPSCAELDETVLDDLVGEQQDRDRAKGRAS
jgi:hypothetical protein